MPRHAMTREQALKALELHPGASFQEIKQAHRDLALVWHPDRFARHDARLREKASERIKEINSAYDVLRSYDDGPSRPNEPRTKHTGTRQGASGTEQSETQRQRSHTKNRSTGSSADPADKLRAYWERKRKLRADWERQRSRHTGPSGEPSVFEDFMDRLSRSWDRLPALVAIVGHLVVVFCFWLSIKREVYPAIVGAMFFTFAPLILIFITTGSDGIESWREAIRESIKALWVWSVLLVAGFVLWMSGFAVLDWDWFVIEASLAAWLLLMLFVVTHVVEPDSVVTKIILTVTQGIGTLLILPLILLLPVMLWMFERCRFVVGHLVQVARRKQQR